MADPRAYRTPGIWALLEAVLADCARLPRAACIGRPEPFDAVVDTAPVNGKPPSRAHRAAVAEAATVCRACPEAVRCPDVLRVNPEKELTA